jgi:hypothetical protein
MRKLLAVFSITTALVVLTSIVAALSWEKSMVAQSNPSSGKPVNVAGSWELQIIPRSPGEPTSTFIMRLVQNGETIDGEFDCNNCFRNIQKDKVRGKIREGKIYLDRPSTAHTSFELIVTGDEMTGMYVGRLGRYYDVKGKRSQ